MRPTTNFLALHTIHGISAPSARGKDTLLSALLAMAGDRVQNVRRYTTRELRPGDHYLPATVEQVMSWDQDDFLEGGLFSPYPGIYYQTRRCEIDAQLAIKPAVSHYLPAPAADIQKLGYKLVLCRLIVINREPDQILERARKREEQDQKFEQEMRETKNLFSEVDIINDFSLKGESGYVDEYNQPIPMGAARGAFQWLSFITHYEKWDPTFLEPIKAKLGL